MEFQKLAQYDDGKGLTFQGAIAEAAKRKVRLPSNLEIDARLQGEEWKTEKEMYPCWTGTLIVYENVGVPFSKTVQYEGLTFNVPKYNAKPEVKAKRRPHFARKFAEEKFDLYLSHPDIQKILSRKHNPFDRIDLINRIFAKEVVISRTNTGVPS
jgi:hypothetical protein